MKFKAYFLLINSVINLPIINKRQLSSSSNEPKILPNNYIGPFYLMIARILLGTLYALGALNKEVELVNKNDNNNIPLSTMQNQDGILPILGSVNEVLDVITEPHQVEEIVAPIEQRVVDQEVKNVSEDVLNMERAVSEDVLGSVVEPGLISSILGDKSKNQTSIIEPIEMESKELTPIIEKGVENIDKQDLGILDSVVGKESLENVLDDSTNIVGKTLEIGDSLSENAGEITDSTGDLNHLLTDEIEENVIDATIDPANATISNLDNKDENKKENPIEQILDIAPLVDQTVKGVDDEAMVVTDDIVSEALSESEKRNGEDKIIDNKQEPSTVEAPLNAIIDTANELSGEQNQSPSLLDDILDDSNKDKGLFPDAIEGVEALKLLDNVTGDTLGNQGLIGTLEKDLDKVDKSIGESTEKLYEGVKQIEVETKEESKKLKEDSDKIELEELEGQLKELGNRKQILDVGKEEENDRKENLINEDSSPVSSIQDPLLSKEVTEAENADPSLKQVLSPDIDTKDPAISQLI